MHQAVFQIPLTRHIYRLRIKPPCPLGSVGGSDYQITPDAV